MIEDFGTFWHFIVRAPESASYFETVDIRGAQKAVDAGLVEKTSEGESPLGHRYSFRLTKQGYRQRIFEQVLADKRDDIRREYTQMLENPATRLTSRITAAELT